MCSHFKSLELSHLSASFASAYEREPFACAGPIGLKRTIAVQTQCADPEIGFYVYWRFVVVILALCGHLNAE
jgi:hypothetical protein